MKITQAKVGDGNKSKPNRRKRFSGEQIEDTLEKAGALRDDPIVRKSWKHLGKDAWSDPYFRILN